MRPLPRRTRRIAAALMVALTVGACATVPRFEAAGDIRAFLIAIRDGDTASFDAHVDRPALKVQLKSRLIADQAAAHGDKSWQAVGATLFGGALVEAGVDVLVQPSAFRAIAIQLGYSPDRPIPSRLEITTVLRRLDGDRVCIVTHKDGPCSLVFKDEDGVWRLIGYEGDLGQLMGGKRRH
jgi:hypothetical protein